MRKTLHSFTLLLFALCLLGGVQEAQASHLLGGDMTYVSLGNNQYRVKFRLYRDCTGITPSAFTLECRNGGCNATATVTAPLVQQGAVESGNPFCAAVSSGPCQGPTGLPNYDVYNYLATVTLPPGNWTLSTDQNARPTLANIVGGNLYVEATLDNRNSSTGAAVSNNSPQFDPQDIPIQYVCWKQPTTITYSSTEADGDSLVYTLAAPLQACGTPATYNAYPGSGTAPTTVILSTNPLCVYTQPAIVGGTYSPTNPIQTGFDTVGTCPIKTGVRRPFNFNQQSRTITFTPGVYNATATPASGLNKYQIAVLITEYRRIDGVRRIVGTVRREANLIVTDCGGNTTPNPVAANPVTPNSGTQAVNNTDTTQLVVRSCNYSRVELNFTDPDNLKTPSANQLLTVTYPLNINTDPNLLDSGDVGTFSLSGNGTTNPKGVFFFQPSPNTVGRTIRLNLRIEDNNCPIKGVQNRVVVIRVVKGQTAQAAAVVGSTGIGNTPLTPSNAICPGGALTLQGNVLRPDSIRRLATNTTQAQVYSYQWTTVGGGNGLPATTNVRNITVSPTVTTRFRLTIAPTLGFAQGSCGDTTSIVVRVVPQPIATATASLVKVCAGAPVLLTGNATRPAGAGSTLTDTYTYTWSGPGVPANTTGRTLTVRPTTRGINTYTLTANGASPYGCASTTTVQVEVVAPPTVRVTTNNAYICAGSTATLQATGTAPTGFTDTYTYSFAPANGLATADQTKANPTVNPTVTTRYRVTVSGNPQSGCSDTASVVVRVLPGVRAGFGIVSALDLNGQKTNHPPVVYTFRDSSAVTGLAQGSTTTYKWTYERIADAAGAPVSSSPTTFSTSALASPLRLEVSGTYRIALTSTVSITSGGTLVSCTPSTFARLVVVPDIQVPNVITPNGDGLNDMFKVSSAGTSSNIAIFNRWGRKVYEQGNYQNNWGGDNQPAGVYYYLLTDRNGVQTKGWIEIVR